jgi:hypothetical protein
VRFRKNFSAVFKKGFICKANTFDNVSGEFPIGFLIWHISASELNDFFPKEISLDVLRHTDGSYAGKKNFYNEQKYINKWIIPINAGNDAIGSLYFTSNDFQQNNLVYISLKETSSHLSSISINESNIFIASIYYAARHCIEHTWINHNDQFLYPDDRYKLDIEFQHDCLIYALFGNKNYISSQHGVNHWIPFSEKEVDAKEKFDSNCMSKYLKEKTFSAEAQAVLDAGRELWRYYHVKIKNNKAASVNASFYDIREFFQGRKESGAMNTKSEDETYNTQLAALRGQLRTLAKKIQPKVYEYGFLKE